MTPKQIAQLIVLTADATLAGTVSIEDNTSLTGALWSMARALNCQEIVDNMLNNLSVEEMKAAMFASGLDLDA